jgi:hypothetical protein
MRIAALLYGMTVAFHNNIFIGAAVIAHSAGNAEFPVNGYNVRFFCNRGEFTADPFAEAAAFTAAAVKAALRFQKNFSPKGKRRFS